MSLLYSFTRAPRPTRPKPPSAQYIEPSYFAPGAISTIAMSANTVYVSPFMVDQPIPIDQVAVETTVAGDLVRVGFGRFRSSGGFVDLMYDIGEIDVSGSTGGKTISASWVMMPGILYGLITAAKSTATLRSVNATHNYFGTSAATGLTFGACNVISLAYPASLPAALTLSSTFQVSAPRMMLRAV